MISSIILLILIHLKIVVYPSETLWQILVTGGMLEIALFFIFTHFQDKKDLKE